MQMRTRTKHRLLADREPSLVHVWNIRPAMSDETAGHLLVEQPHQPRRAGHEFGPGDGKGEEMEATMSDVTDGRLAELRELSAKQTYSPLGILWHEIGCALAELQRRRAVERWIPVGERLPDAPYDVLARYKAEPGIERTTLGQFSREWGWQDIGINKPMKTPFL